MMIKTFKMPFQNILLLYTIVQSLTPSNSNNPTFSVCGIISDIDELFSFVTFEKNWSILAKNPIFMVLAKKFHAFEFRI